MFSCYWLQDDYIIQEVKIYKNAMSYSYSYVQVHY